MRPLWRRTEFGIAFHLVPPLGARHRHRSANVVEPFYPLEGSPIFLYHLYWDSIRERLESPPAR